jgi:uncharacterized integral membrane protein
MSNLIKLFVWICLGPLAVVLVLGLVGGELIMAGYKDAKKRIG